MPYPYDDPYAVAPAEDAEQPVLQRRVDPYAQAAQMYAPPPPAPQQDEAGYAAPAVVDDSSQFTRGLRAGLLQNWAGVKALGGAAGNLIKPGLGSGLIDSAGETLQRAQLVGPTAHSFSEDPLGYIAGTAGELAPSLALAATGEGLAGSLAGRAALKGAEKVALGGLERRAASRAAEKLATGLERGKGAQQVPELIAAGRQEAAQAMRPGIERLARRTAAKSTRLTGPAAGTAAFYPSIVGGSVEGSSDSEGNLVGGLRGADRAGTVKILVGDLAASAIGAYPVTRALNRVSGGAAQKEVAKATQSFLKRVGKETGTQALAGGSAALASTVAQLATHKWVNDHVDLMSPEALQQYRDSVIAGTALGGLIGGAVGGIRGGQAAAGRAGEAVGNAADRLKAFGTGMKDGLAAYAERRRTAYEGAKGKRYKGGERVNPDGTPYEGPLFTDIVGDKLNKIGAKAGEGLKGAFHAAKDAFTPEGFQTAARAVADVVGESQAGGRDAVNNTADIITQAWHKSTAALSGTKEQIAAAKAKLDRGFHAVLDKLLENGSITPEDLGAGQRPEGPTRAAPDPSFDAESTFQRHLDAVDGDEGLSRRGEPDADARLARQIRNKVPEDIEARMARGEQVSADDLATLKAAKDRQAAPPPYAGPAELTPAQRQLVSQFKASSTLRQNPLFASKLGRVAQKVISGDDLTRADTKFLNAAREIDPFTVYQWEAFGGKIGQMHDSVRNATGRSFADELATDNRRPQDLSDDVGTREAQATETVAPRELTASELSPSDVRSMLASDTRAGRAKEGREFENVPLTKQERGRLQKRLQDDLGVNTSKGGDESSLFIAREATPEGRKALENKLAQGDAVYIGNKRLPASKYGKDRARAFLSLTNLIQREQAQNHGLTPLQALYEGLASLHLAGVKNIDMSHLKAGVPWTSAKDGSHILTLSDGQLAGLKRAVKTNNYKAPPEVRVKQRTESTQRAKLLGELQEAKSAYAKAKEAADNAQADAAAAYVARKAAAKRASDNPEDSAVVERKRHAVEKHAALLKEAKQLEASVKAAGARIEEAKAAAAAAGLTGRDLKKFVAAEKAKNKDVEAASLQERSNVEGQEVGLIDVRAEEAKRVTRTPPAKTKGLRKPVPSEDAVTNVGSHSESHSEVVRATNLRKKYLGLVDKAVPRVPDSVKRELWNKSKNESGTADERKARYNQLLLKWKEAEASKKPFVADAKRAADTAMRNAGKIIGVRELANRRARGDITAKQEEVLVKKLKYGKNDLAFDYFRREQNHEFDKAYVQARGPEDPGTPVKIPARGRAREAYNAVAKARGRPARDNVLERDYVDAINSLAETAAARMARWKERAKKMTSEERAAAQEAGEDRPLTNAEREFIAALRYSEQDASEFSPIRRALEDFDDVHPVPRPKARPNINDDKQAVASAFKALQTDSRPTADAQSQLYAKLSNKKRTALTKREEAFVGAYEALQDLLAEPRTKRTESAVAKLDRLAIAEVRREAKSEGLSVKELAKLRKMTQPELVSRARKYLSNNALAFKRAEKFAEAQKKSESEADHSVDFSDTGLGLHEAVGDGKTHDLTAETTALNAVLHAIGNTDDVVVKAMPPHMQERYSGAYYRDTGTIYIHPNLHGAERLTVLSHELGHHILRSELAREAGLGSARNTPKNIEGLIDRLRDTNPKLHKQLTEGFEKWIAQTENSFHRRKIDVYAERKPYARAKALLERNTRSKATLNTLMKTGAGRKQMSYILDINEYLADQIARALTHPRQGKSAAAKFFKTVAKKLKLVYKGLFEGKGGKKYAPDGGVEAWVRDMFDRDTEAVSRAMNEAVSKAGARDAIKAALLMETAVAERRMGGTGGGPRMGKDASLAFFRDYITKTLTPEETLILDSALQTGAAKQRLDKLYEGDQNMLSAMRDAGTGRATRIAAALIAHVNGDLNVGRKAGHVLDGIGTMLRRVFNLAGEGDYAKRLLDDLATGKIEAMRKAKQKYDVRELEAVGRPKFQKSLNKAEDLYNRVVEPGRRLLRSATDRLRMTGVPALAQVGAALQLHQGQTGKDPGLIPAVTHKTAQFIHVGGKIFDGLSAEEARKVLTVLQTQEPGTGPFSMGRIGDPKLDKAVGQARALFKKFHEYAKANGHDLGFRENYFPVVMDTHTAGNADRLTTLLSHPRYEKRIRELYSPRDKDGNIKKLNDAPIDELVARMVEGADKFGNSEAEFAGVPAKFRAQNYRFMQFVYDDLAAARKSGSAKEVREAEARVKEFAELQTKDPAAVFSRYLVPGVRDVEFTARFGRNGEKLEAMLKQAKEEGATDAQIAEARGFVDNAMGRTGLDGSPVLRKLLGKNLAAKIATPRTRKGIAYIQAYENARLLPLATISSLVDPMGIAVRTGGDFKTAWDGFKVGMKTLVNKQTREEMRDMLQQLGSADDFLASDILNSNFGSVGLPDTMARKINDFIFKVNGLAGWTRATRFMALRSAHGFMLKHANMDNPTSARYMDELGLKKGDVTAVLEEGKAPTVRVLSEAERAKASRAELERDERVRTALLRFIDEAILRPTSQQTPGWFGDPYAGLVTQYKSFAYAIHDQISKRIRLELQHGNAGVLLPAMAYVPVIIAAEMLRGFIQYGPGGNSHRQDWGPEDWTAFATLRSGLLGPQIQFKEDALGDLKRHKLPGSSFLGPAYQQAGHVYDTAVGRRKLDTTVENALPGSALYKHWEVGDEAYDQA